MNKKYKDVKAWEDMIVVSATKCKNCDDYSDNYSYGDDYMYGYYYDDDDYKEACEHRKESEFNKILLKKMITIEEDKEKAEKVRIANEEKRKKEIEESNKIYDSIPLRIAKLLNYDRDRM